MNCSARQLQCAPGARGARPSAAVGVRRSGSRVAFVAMRASSGELVRFEHHNSATGGAATLSWVTLVGLRASVLTARRLPAFVLPPLLPHFATLSAHTGNTQQQQQQQPAAVASRRQALLSAAASAALLPQLPLLLAGAPPAFAEAAVAGGFKELSDNILAYAFSYPVATASGQTLSLVRFSTQQPKGSGEVHRSFWHCMCHVWHAVCPP